MACVNASQEHHVLLLLSQLFIRLLSALFLETCAIAMNEFRTEKKKV